ncbi:Hypothetical predicted protein, partial [Drosophila guanche]
ELNILSQSSSYFEPALERIMLPDIGSSCGVNGNGSHHVGNGHGLVSGIHSSDSSSGIASGSASSEKLATRTDEASLDKGNDEGDADEDEDDDDDDDDEDEDETT